MDRISSLLNLKNTAILLLLVNLICFNHLMEVRNEEPRRAIVAIEMMESGEYIAPQIYGEPYYNKPPLYNWILAGSFSIFGTSEWALRLPGVLSFLMIGFILYRFCRKEFSEQTALLIAFAFLTGGDLLFFGSVIAGEIDLFYSLVVMLQVLLVYKYGKEGNYLKLFLFTYILTAVGVLTKGIPSLAFQALTLLGYFIVYKKFWKLFSWQHIAGIGLFGGIMALFFYSYAQENDLSAFLSQQFKEASQRTGNEHGIGETLLQICIFPFTLIEKMFPWSLLFLPLFSGKFKAYMKAHPIVKFSLVFIVSNIIIYWTAPNVRIRYIYMFFPFFMIVIIGFLDKIDWKSTLAKIPGYVYLFGMGAIGLGLIALPFILGVASVFTISVGIILSGISIFITLKSYTHLHQPKFLWFLILILIMGRMGYNLIVAPEMSNLNKHLMYRELGKQIVDKADGRTVYLTGGAEKIYPDVQLLGNVLYQGEIAYPPGIPFQVPYYYAHYSDKLINYAPVPEDKSAVYLIFERDLWMVGEPVNELYQFEANNTQLQVVLFDFNL